MDYLSALIYGIVQGITEFLPISSSGHLALLPKVLHIKDPGVTFDLMMHLGTALAVMIYYKKRLWKIVSSVPYFFDKDLTYEQKVNLLWLKNLFLASLMTAILAFLLKGLAESYGRNSTFIAINLIVIGIFMFLTDHFCYENKKTGESFVELKNSYLSSVLIGLSQALAIFPGVSRSGITITSARLMKLSRDEAAEFSFLLSLPAIFGASLYKIPFHIAKQGFAGWPLWLFGIFISFLVGIITIHYFLKIIRKIGLWTFTVYRIILAILILSFV